MAVRTTDSRNSYYPDSLCSNESKSNTPRDKRIIHIKKDMKIAYSCNDYYIPQTGISIISLCENNKDAREIIIYFIGKDVSTDNIGILRDLTERYGRVFIYIPFDTIAYDLKISAIGRHIETIYSKVFFSRIEGLDKIIYLDSDIVVDGSLQPLWDENLEDVYLGAVQTVTKAKQLLDMSEETPFFNDGMAIVNVNFCRNNHLIEQVLKVVADYNGNPPVLSEGALNKVCQGHVKFISLRWNCMAGLLYMGRLNMHYLARQLNMYSEQDLKESCAHPVIIHYLTAFYNRPWLTPCTHPFRNIYTYYQSKSPWKNDVPKYSPLPLRIRAIDFCFRTFGPRFSQTIQKFINML